MDIWGKIEKLITEHGSAAILRDHVALLREQFTLSEKKAAMLEVRTRQLESENADLKQKLGNLEKQCAYPGNPRGYVCDHCGSPDLKRIGNRADPTFGVMGVKQAVFSCASCGKESAFTP